MSPQRPILSLFLFTLSLGFCFGSYKDDPLNAPKHEHFGLMTRAYRTTQTSRSQATLSVDDYGAKANDGRDDTEAFKKAWNQACSKGAALVVPEKKVYHLKPITFSGPCQPNTAFMVSYHTTLQSGDVWVSLRIWSSPKQVIYARLQVYGTIKAWPHMSAYEEDRRHWIQFNGIPNFRVDGGGIGTFNGNGKKWWQNSCKINKNLPCKVGPTAVTFNECSNLRVENLRFKNSQQMHMNFQKCFNVRVSSLVVRAPANSPNTDGIHVTETQNILISNSIIGTGDDCISIVSGSKNVRVTGITCGPGHGISIGSLGADNSEAEVSNVVVNRATLIGTTNGVRIKTWQGGSGYARNIKFMNIAMKNVTNPIIIDQNYCDQEEPCAEQVSAVQLSNVVYQNIRGTSASETAIKFNCSRTVPCRDIYVQDVILEPEGRGGAIASCDNVRYVNKGRLFPQCS